MIGYRFGSMLNTQVFKIALSILQTVFMMDGPETVFAILSIKNRCFLSSSFDDRACFLFGSTLLDAIAIFFSWIKNLLDKPDAIFQSNSMLQNSTQTSINDASTNLRKSCEMRRDDL